MTNEDEAGDRKDGQPENKDGKDHGVLYIGMDLGTSRTSVSVADGPSDARLCFVWASTASA